MVDLFPRFDQQTEPQDWTPDLPGPDRQPFLLTAPGIPLIFAPTSAELGLASVWMARSTASWRAHSAFNAIRKAFQESAAERICLWYFFKGDHSGSQLGKRALRFAPFARARTNPYRSKLVSTVIAGRTRGLSGAQHRAYRPQLPSLYVLGKQLLSPGP
jgi:hypothetical protein